MGGNKMNKLIFLTVCFFSSQTYAQQNIVNKTLSTSELLIHSTLKIECLSDIIVGEYAKTLLSTGSAFFFEFKIDSYTLNVLVSNAHVVKGTAITKITFTETDSLGYPKKGKKVEYVNDNTVNPWILNEKYDLAILPVEPIQEQINNNINKFLQFILKKVKYHLIQRSMIYHQLKNYLC
jgi:hypothetical protein